MSDSNSGVTKRCPKCGIEYTTEERTIVKAALDHWLEEHSDSDQLHDILTSAWARVDCTECGQEFFSTISFGAGRIGAEACCPECVEEDEFRKLYAQELTPEELVEREADPTTDTLDSPEVARNERQQDTGSDQSEADE